MKNLLIDPWLPIVRKDGSREIIALYNIVEGYQANPVIDIEAPRPDLRSGIFQLLIGVLQVMAMPEDEEKWEDLWYEPYAGHDLKTKFSKYEDCFVIDNVQGPAFMQDYDWRELYSLEKSRPVENLLIDAPGDNTKKYNTDHFVKRAEIQLMDPYWASVALYALQTFATSGGRGHYVGLRGGGPMTTIILPKGKDATLWKKLWLNIFHLENVEGWASYSKQWNIFDIFPWMTQTRICIKDEITTPDDCHPFQMYFGMPRRIRLKFTSITAKCELTGKSTDAGVRQYYTLHNGVKYRGPWAHPLNAYFLDPKKPETLPNSMKGQPGGVSYRHWLGLSRRTEGHTSAKVVSHLNSDSKRIVLNECGAILWVGGYDIDDKYKARCWYESTLPVFDIPPESETRVIQIVEAMIIAANGCAKGIRSCIKQSWFDRPKDAKGDISFLDISFWQNTEQAFYTILQQIIDKPFDDTVVPNCISSWERELRREANQLFDKWALSMQEDGLDMKRAVRARDFLGKNINKAFQGLQNLKNPE